MKIRLEEARTQEASPKKLFFQSSWDIEKELHEKNSIVIVDV